MTIEVRIGADGSSSTVGPAGPAGADGATGAAGVAGADGVGVPAGGSADDLLSKINGTDYNTQWSTPSIRSVDYTADDQISGGEIRDAEGNFQPAGVGVIIDDASTFDTSATLYPFTKNNVNQSILFSGTGATTWSTLGAVGSGQLATPVGAMWMGQVFGSGTLTFIGGSGVTIRYWSAAGASPADVDVVFVRGTIFNVRKVSDSLYDVWHN